MADVLEQKKEETIVKKETKPGWKTTEFWTSLGASGVGILTTLGVLTPEQANTVVQAIGQIVGGILAVAPIVGYAISRGLAKKV